MSAIQANMYQKLLDTFSEGVLVKRICTFCKENKDIKEYGNDPKQCKRYGTKIPGRVCRKCVHDKKCLKDPGRKRNFGIQKLNAALVAEGKWKCRGCDEIMLLTTEFYSKTKRAHGFNPYCKKCHAEKTNKTAIRSVKERDDAYVRAWAVNRYGLKSVKEVTPEIFEIAKLSITAKDSLFYELDGKKFKTMVDFAKYVEATYNVPEGAVVARVIRGWDEIDCTLPTHIARRRTRAKPIKITDIVTGEVKTFMTIDDACSVINNPKALSRYAKSGLIKYPRNYAKHKNPLKIEFV